MVGEAMRSVQHQLDIVTAAFAAPSPARVPLERAFGLLSAEEVAAGCQLPGFDQALVDGFAVRAADLLAGSAASPVVLPLLAVGQAFGEGAFAARVEAGAPVPDGADAVLPLGDAALREEPAIEVATPVHAGAYVRKAGSDVEIGDVVLRRGAIVGPAQIGLLAAAGRQDVLVHPRPRAAVFALGRELVDVGAAPGPGQLFDVNSHALTAAALDAGAEANRAGILPLEPERLREAVSAQLEHSDLLIISGAASGESAELAQKALSELGDIEITRVAMHPGSTQGFGRLGPNKVPVFLLPGNPVGALVVFEVMVRPVIRMALSRRQALRRVTTARTASALTSTFGRMGFLRGRLTREGGGYVVHTLGGPRDSASHQLSSLADANCLIMIDPDTTDVRAGDKVNVAFLAQRG